MYMADGLETFTDFRENKRLWVPKLVNTPY